jgi:hypothetical protein
MFSICENMKLAHLPEPGGLYDQSPELLDGFKAIFAERAEAEAEERAKSEAESKRKSANQGQRSRASRPRR